MGTIIGAIKGVTGSLDDGSYVRRFKEAGVPSFVEIVKVLASCFG